MVTGKNRFVFVCPMYNAAATLPQMLHSLCGQSYENWKLILVDDVSDEENHKLAAQTILQFQSMMGGSYSDKIVDSWNEEKRWEVANVLAGIKMCEDDDIVCRIDADDYLVDLDALTIIDQVYNEHGLDALWTAHRWGFSDHNISGKMPDQADPYRYPWVSSHLKTFRKRLINGIPIDNFKNMEGQLIRRAGDQGLYLPVLRAAKRRAYLPRACYHYTIDEQGGAVYQTADAKFQKAEADFIRARGYIEHGTPWEDVIT
jgi:glycosyltransferase involved in cell wall biosynthesis